MEKRIYLINAGNDPKYENIVVHGTSFPPLGVVSLGTAVNERKPEWKVSVFDGQMTDIETIVTGIKTDKPTVVGVSVLSTSYQNALYFAKAAKEIGATTIFGNDQAAITGRNMLIAQKDIDYICTADAGERPFVQFLEFLDGFRSIDDVPRLMYRTSKGIEHNVDLPELEPAEKYSILDQIPIPDRNLLSETLRQQYRDNYHKSHPDENVKGTSTINRFRGCSNARVKCTYCGILDLSIRTSSPELFWADVRAAKESGAERLMEAGDSFSSVPKYLEKLVAAKPNDLDFSAFVYTSAKDVSTNLTQIYKKLGIHRVNMGLDSGDDIMLKRMKHPSATLAKNTRAVQLISSAGIQSYASFVLGGPGETRESLENTVKFTKWLIDEHLVDGTEAQPLFPGVNSKAGKMLLNPDFAIETAASEGWRLRNIDLLRQMPEKWSSHENPDPEIIARDWASIFSKVDYDDLVMTAEYIQRHSRDKGIQSGSSWTRND